MANEHYVTVLGDGISVPFIVAAESVQRRGLVHLALRDPGFTGVDARQHTRVQFYVDPHPRLPGMPPLAERRWLEVGHFARFGGVLFIDETTPPGADWAWFAVPNRVREDLPVVYHDHASHTQFPPRCVMPIDEVADVVVEWVNTGVRPTSVQWLPVNSFVWYLDRDGNLRPDPGPPPIGPA